MAARDLSGLEDDTHRSAEVFGISQGRAVQTLRTVIDDLLRQQDAILVLLGEGLELRLIQR